MPVESVPPLSQFSQPDEFSDPKTHSKFQKYTLIDTEEQSTTQLDSNNS